MKNVVRLTRKDLWERQLLENLSLSDRLRNHTLEDISSLSDDLQHISFVVKSIQTNYQAVLEENQRLKSLLIGLMDGCYCWEGNRCPNCRAILATLNPDQPPRSEHTKNSDPSIAKIRRFADTQES
ncbi:hypothetical protein AmaxDRAFT_1687 [Limnospira maxima CS-328]|uniref:Uncharacterized protein n=1 Tax=Limnospira maxima CS-328 TaxID=513049 RepID=B5VYU5_LIMMA|nr:hypothetical protein [Limnospira maxima]EDZ95417.1 hypothetical protein AmaxDRAFT_1687 [Limnospira maxima CS-328]MDC0836677.1 hypothetical protein [Limnoraphis robusta]